MKLPPERWRFAAPAGVKGEPAGNTCKTERSSLMHPYEILLCKEPGEEPDDPNKPQPDPDNPNTPDFPDGPRTPDFPDGPR